MGFRMSPSEELHVTAARVVACASGSARPWIVKSGCFCGVCGKVTEDDPTCSETGATDACGGDILTLQDLSAVQGAVVFDCRPPLLPVSLDLSGIGLLLGLPPAASASVGVPPIEHGLSISGGTLMDLSFRSLGLLH